jgi:FlaA1/EpsC-like NDP-sugar epimerase
MTRFNITLNEGVDMVMWVLRNSLGGEIFVPKIPSYRITDVAEAVSPSCKKEIVGIRPGEKLHEEMITFADGPSTYDLGKYYAILPHHQKTYTRYKEASIALKLVAKGFSYSSNENESFLSVEEIRKLIKEHIDTSFKPN